MTINKVEKQHQYSLMKSLMTIERQTIFTNEMEGGREATASGLGAWVMADNEGGIYSTIHSGSILDEKDENGRYKTTVTLKSYYLDEVPAELTLHLLSVTRYEELDENWKVSLF